MKTNIYFLIKSRPVLFGMRNVSDKSLKKKLKHVLYSIAFLFENRAVFERMWKNFVEPSRPQMTIWRMRITCWIPRTTNTHSEYIILIALPLQQWLQKRASLLHFTFIVSLVAYAFHIAVQQPVATRS